MRNPESRLVPALYVFAVFSGSAALMYEVAWTKMLALSFGRTTLAASSVLGGFMAGMGIGAWLYHRAPLRRFGALRVYAGLEIGIAISTALLTPGFALLPELFLGIAETVPAGLETNVLRIGFVLVVLLVPAALMGATYPALCAVLIHSRDGVGRHLGPIYGLNTVGAAAGALVAGFVLVEQLGLRGTIFAANAVNLSVGVGALLLARAGDSAGSRVEELAESDALIPTRLPSALTGTLLFGSGFATLAYEIVWFRALRYLFGNSTYALTIMLVTFLLGLGVGGLLCSPRRQQGFPERNLALAQLGIALLALAAIAALLLVLADSRLLASLSIFHGVAVLPWWQRLGVDLLLGLSMMLPATLLMGFTFPLASRLFLGDVRRLGQRVGAAYLLSNLGSITGAVAAAVYILPTFGTVGGTRWIAVVNLLLGLLILARLAWAPSTRVAWALGSAGVVAAAFALLPSSLPFREGERLGMQLVFEEEGDLATVQVWTSLADPRRRMMFVDGSPIGITEGLQRPIYAKQALLAHLPMALEPRIRRTLNIGLGSGTTLHALSGYRDLELLDVVEISASVAHGSRFFEEARALDDPRAWLYVEDAAHFLVKTPKRYDLIISDGKLARGFAGNQLMMCRDFYEQAAHRLRPGGIFIQWIPLRHTHENFQVILRTFLASFPEVEVFFEDPGGVFMLGSDAPIGRRHAIRLTNPRAARQLARLGIPDAESVFARWVASGAGLREVIAEGPVSTWDRGSLEYAIYRSTESEMMIQRAPNLELLLAARQRDSRNPFLATTAPEAASTQLIREARARSLRGDLPGALRLAVEAAEANPDDPYAAAAVEGYRRHSEQVGSPGVLQQ